LCFSIDPDSLKAPAFPFRPGEVPCRIDVSVRVPRPAGHPGGPHSIGTGLATTPIALPTGARGRRVLLGGHPRPYNPPASCSLSPACGAPETSLRARRPAVTRPLSGEPPSRAPSFLARPGRCRDAIRPGNPGLHRPSARRTRLGRKVVGCSSHRNCPAFESASASIASPAGGSRGVGPGRRRKVFPWRCRCSTRGVPRSRVAGRAAGQPLCFPLARDPVLDQGEVARAGGDHRLPLALITYRPDAVGTPLRRHLVHHLDLGPGVAHGISSVDLEMTNSGPGAAAGQSLGSSGSVVVRRMSSGSTVYRW